MSSYTTFARAIALVLSLAVLHPKGLLAQVNVVSSGSGGVGLGGTNVWTGSNSFLDNAFFVRDDADQTKSVAFAVEGVTTGTTRTLTVPNANGTLALLGLAQTFSAAQSFSGSGQALAITAADAYIGISGATNGAVYFGGTQAGRIGYRASQTPDTMQISTGTLGNSIVISEDADTDFDFAHPQQTNPTIFGHSANQNTAQWWSLTHNATNTVMNSGTGGVVFPMTGSIGWSVVAGANTACTTTCTNACVFGWNTAAGEVAVDCADATADKCLCAGAN